MTKKPIAASDEAPTTIDLMERLQRSLATPPAAGSGRARGPSNFDVVDAAGLSRGIYDTLEEARGCVAFDHLTRWEIWQGDHIVDESEGPHSAAAMALAPMHAALDRAEQATSKKRPGKREPWRCRYCGAELLIKDNCREPACLEKTEAARARMGLSTEGAR